MKLLIATCPNSLRYNTCMEGPEATGVPDTWNYSLFKDYLLALSRGKDFILPLEQYPREIELSQEWHKILNSMRDRTAKTRVEHVALIATSKRMRSILLPSTPASGWSSHHVHPLATQIQITRARLDPRIDGYIGLFHSHPPQDIGFFRFKIPMGRLSAGDLHIVLTSPSILAIGVTDGIRNSLAFRTRESITPSETQ